MTLLIFFFLCRIFLVWSYPSCLFFILLLCFRCHPKYHYQVLCQGPYSHFLPGVLWFQVYVLYLSLVHLELIFVSGVRYGSSFFFLTCEYLILSKLFIKETVFSPLSNLGSPVNYWLTIYYWVYFWGLYSVLFFYLSLFIQVLLMLMAVAFWYSLKSGSVMPSAFFSLLRISLVIWVF